MKKSKYLLQAESGALCANHLHHGSRTLALFHWFKGRLNLSKEPGHSSQVLSAIMFVSSGHVKLHVTSINNSELRSHKASRIANPSNIQNQNGHVASVYSYHDSHLVACSSSVENVAIWLGLRNAIHSLQWDHRHQQQRHRHHHGHCHQHHCRRRPPHHDHLIITNSPFFSVTLLRESVLVSPNQICKASAWMICGSSHCAGVHPHVNQESPLQRYHRCLSETVEYSTCFIVHIGISIATRWISLYPATFKLEHASTLAARMLPSDCFQISIELHNSNQLWVLEFSCTGFLWVFVFLMCFSIQGKNHENDWMSKLWARSKPESYQNLNRPPVDWKTFHKVIQPETHPITTPYKSSCQRSWAEMNLQSKGLGMSDGMRTGWLQRMLRKTRKWHGLCIGTLALWWSVTVFLLNHAWHFDLKICVYIIISYIQYMLVSFSHVYS